MSTPEEFLKRRNDALAAFRDVEGRTSESSMVAGWNAADKAVYEHGEQRLKAARDRGYVFLNDLAQEVRALRDRVDGARDEAFRLARDRARSADRERDDLKRRSRDLERDDGSRGDWDLKRFEDAVSDLKRDVENAASAVVAVVGDSGTRAQALGPKFDWVDLCLHHDQGSVVALAPGESLYLAVKAEWRETGDPKKDPDGVFRVTDRRMIMERREKEGGFLGIGGKTVHAALWEVPLEALASVRPEQAGLFGGKDLVHIEVKPGQAHASLTIEVKGGVDANAFAEQLRAAIDGGLERLRTP